MFSSLDIDECMEGTDNCDRNATCTNTDGGFNCTCNNGYSGNGTTNDCNGEHAMFVHDGLQEISCLLSSFYTDINECELQTDTCHAPNGLCYNTIGSFTCRCEDGFEGDGFNCTSEIISLIVFF